jgi:undecaprenyl diphosphate synthase
MQTWIDPETLSEAEFRKYTDCSILPIPDMIIRTGWDVRHSGFLLYDSAYAEYYFTDKNWPEFNEEELLKALSSYNDRKRNFWK